MVWVNIELHACQELNARDLNSPAHRGPVFSSIVLFLFTYRMRIFNRLGYTKIGKVLSTEASQRTLDNSDFPRNPPNPPA